MTKHLRAAWEFIVALVTRFREERATQTAGSLTYTTLLSMVPLFTVVLAVSTAFPVFDKAIESLQEFIVDNVLPDTPGIDAITTQIDSFTRNAGRLTAIGIAGVLAGIAFEIAKRGFALYLAQVPTYTLIYGAFATIPIFLVWLYMSWMVVLGGAIFTAMLPAYYAKPERHRAPGEELAEALGV